MNSANEGTNSFPNEDAAAHGAAASLSRNPDTLRFRREG